MAKFLVTGGAGFIGSNYLNLMVKKYPQDQFVCLDSLTYAGNKNNLNAIVDCSNFKFIKGDITNMTEVFALFEKEAFDYVINFAAETHVDNSIVNPSLFIKTNVIGTQVLLDACVKYGIKRYHQISTDEVYGDLSLNNSNKLFNEEDKLYPSSPYSASKASADLLVLSYHRTYGLPITISRCSNNFGPYQYHEKLIPLIVEKALKNEPLPIYGNGENIRDWIYVEDHCNAVDLIVRQGKDGEVYNIGCNYEISNLNLVKKILDILDKDHSLINFVKERPGHDFRYGLNATKLVSELGWKNFTNFDEVLNKTVMWYKNLQEKND